MVLDPELETKYGKDWHKKRKQVPWEWSERLFQECVGAAAGKAIKIKGRISFSDLPGEHGQEARNVVQQIKQVVECENKDGDRVEMEEMALIFHSMTKCDYTIDL